VSRLRVRSPQLPRESYAYLLGVYLGDGCLGEVGTSWSLRITLDEAYPGIIDSCCEAIEVLRGNGPIDADRTTASS
jgi:hypothetical protein